MQRRWLQGQRRLKSDFYYIYESRDNSKIIYFVYHCQIYQETESGTQR